MKALKPTTLTDGMLLSHSIAEPTTAEIATSVASGVDADYVEWDVGYTYPIGGIVYYNHKVYEALRETVGDNPETAFEDWVIGSTERWAMFDQIVGTDSSAANSITFTAELATVNNVHAFGFLNMSGVTSILIEMIDIALGSASISGSPTTSPSASVSHSKSASPSASPTSSPSSSVSSSPSGIFSGSVSDSPSASPSSSVSPSSSISGSVSSSLSPSTSISGSPSASPSSGILEFGTEALSISSSPAYFGEGPIELVKVAPAKVPGRFGIPTHVIFSHNADLGEFPDGDYGWYEYFFSDVVYPESVSFVNPVNDLLNGYELPLQNVLLRVTLTGGAAMSIGTMIFGEALDLGNTLWGVNLGIIDYSTKETDVYGQTTVLERVFAKTMSCELFFEHTRLKTIFNFLASVRATPCLWIASDDERYDAAIVYGFYKDFNIELRDYSGSYCSLEVEGLT